jgi:8-amino-7-oxononanoate synthase
LLVDDAHGIGVVGDEGRGSCAAQVRPELLVVTFGKAFGVSGAAVLCSEAMADYLLQFARHLIYSTAMPPAQAVALSAALWHSQR